MKLAVDKGIPLAESAFGSFGSLTLVETPAMGPDVVRDADVLIVRSETKVDRSLLDGSRVRFVGTATIGFDHIDVGYLASRRIVLASAPGSNSNSVKEYVVAGLLHLSALLGFSLRGKTIGVVGVGHVGSKVVKAAEALGMTVLQNDPPLARRIGGKGFVPLDDLMECDVITVHVPLTRYGMDPTYHLFDGPRMKKLRPSVVFINTSRGAVVQTEAFIAAIREGRIAQSVVDVWEHEPDIDLQLLSGVTLGTPHIAGYSMEGKLNAVRMVRQALCHHFAISSAWEHPAELPATAPEELVVPSEELSAEELLHRVVRQCYDIRLDDRNVREMASIPASKRAEFFRGLRSGYRLRHEFTGRVVHLPQVHAYLEEMLTPLGFRCRTSPHDGAGGPT
jgi:erythronate-4-phosphate dehydrogenase